MSVDLFLFKAQAMVKASFRPELRLDLKLEDNLRRAIKASTGGITFTH